MPSPAGWPVGDPLMSTVAAVVLCGGQSRRFGSDKTQAAYAGGTVLDALLTALPGDWEVVCVGPQRRVSRPARWTVEDPPGGGPLAGIAAGLAATTPTVEVVVVLAGDLPAAGPAAGRLLDHLRAAPASMDAVAAVDDHGRENPLLAAYRATALRATLPADPANRPARTLLDALAHQTLRVSTTESHDVDTPADLDALRRRLEG